MAEKRARQGRVWAVVVAAGVVAGLYWWTTGLDLPDTVRSVEGIFGIRQATGSSVAPVNVRLSSGGRVDASWAKLSDRELNYYMVEVIAVSPVSYDYGVPYYPGVVDTFTRVYPAVETNEDLADSGRSDRVGTGQLWRICVTGMRATPKNVDITPYVITGSKSCSEDFRLR